MSKIKTFIDRVAMAEIRQTREVVMPLAEAKELRDEVMKLLIDKNDKKGDDEIIQVVMRGGGFK